MNSGQRATRWAINQWLVEALEQVETLSREHRVPVDGSVQSLTQSTAAWDWCTNGRNGICPGEPVAYATVDRLIQKEFCIRKPLNESPVDPLEALLGSRRPVVKTGGIKSDFHNYTWI
jgi:hypothetical protein